MNKQKRIRRTAAFLALLPLFALTTIFVSGGCRKREAAGKTGIAEGTDADITEILENVYRGVPLALSEEFRGLSTSMLSTKIPKLDAELGMATVYAEDADGMGYAVTISAESGTVREIPVPIPEGHRCSAGAWSLDGEQFWYVTADETVGNGVQDAIDLALCCLDPESGGSERRGGNLRGLFDTTDEQERGLHVSSVAVDADGDIWIGTPGEILVVSPDGEKRASFPGFYNAPLALAASPDPSSSGEGEVWLPKGGAVLLFDKSRPDGPRTLPLPEEAERIVFCGNYDFCFASGSGVYGAAIADGEVTAELLMSYPNSDVDPADCTLLGAFDSENLLFAEDRGFTLYRASEDVSLASLCVIEVASAFDLDYGGLGFTTQIVEFNKSHPDCRVVLNDYSVWNTADNPDGGVSRLLTDMMTGIAKPDIVIAKTRGGINSAAQASVSEQIVKHGLYADLSPCLDSDGEVNWETVSGAVLRFCSAEDGGLWGIAPCFTMETLIAPASLISEEEAENGWTLSGLLDRAERLPGGTFLMGGLTRENAEKELLGPDGYGAFVDLEAGVCSFDSPEFLRWLRFFDSLPADEEALRRSAGLGSMSGDTLREFYEGQVLLERVRIVNGFSDLAELEAVFGTKDWVPVGFPARGHNGTTVICPAVVIMTSFCRNREPAWELIRTLVKDSIAGRASNNPTLKPAARAYTAQFMVPGAYSAVTFSGKSRMRQGGYAEDGVIPKQEDLNAPGWVCVPTWEDYDRYERLLDRVVSYPMTEALPAEIDAIVREEASAFSRGVGSAEDCAAKIQSRVSIWIAENR
ncbi:MAG: hypothetical protein E7576_04320 [Ruminococcaceae bacterium]|jgi:hypothetical protein|nr:hypothetical protein [Oscillospiraceae bacterium]